jgi:hypothetical protein
MKPPRQEAATTLFFDLYCALRILSFALNLLFSAGALESNLVQNRFWAAFCVLPLELSVQCKENPS